ncbi:MAG: hypothetical protein CM15mP103_04340 [Gammaproteobacteria bacterium]|nr:MAG: hypothetical protein CM15mP103_04340 [Gammaproteobacteria bacterium]
MPEGQTPRRQRAGMEIVPPINPRGFYNLATISACFVRVAQNRFWLHQFPKQKRSSSPHASYRHIAPASPLTANRQDASAVRHAVLWVSHRSQGFPKGGLFAGQKIYKSRGEGVSV